MRSLVLGSILVGLIAIPNRPEVYSLSVGAAADCVGGDGRFVPSPEAECTLDPDCEEDGDFCGNGWGTECSAHHVETKMFPGFRCAYAEDKECRLWIPLQVCKFSLTCGFDEDENCVASPSLFRELSNSVSGNVLMKAASARCRCSGDASRKLSLNHDSRQLPSESRAGFTIVELLVVLAITTLLLSFFCPQFRTPAKPPEIRSADIIFDRWGSP